MRTNKQLLAASAALNAIQLVNDFKYSQRPASGRLIFLALKAASLCVRLGLYEYSTLLRLRLNNLVVVNGVSYGN